MKILTFLSLLLSFNVLAHEACGEALPDSLEDLLKLQKALNWHAATDNDVKNAHCLRTKNFSIEEMKNWMSENDGKRINETVHGISFEDESEENIKAFRHLTTAVDFISRPDPERQKTFSSNCKKVQCAMDEIFGKSTATHLLFMHRKFGMNGSHIPYVNSDPWRKNELDVLLLALNDFPENILPVKENKKMVRFKRGYMRDGGENTIANAVMEFFDPFNDQSSWQKRTTVTHELAHVLAMESKIDDSPEWTKLGGWDETTKIVNGEKKTTSPSSVHRAVSKYGEANRYEDFAEAVVSFRYNPTHLKSISPEKYELIKTVIFDNVEYTSQEACQNPNRLTDKLRDKATRLAGQWKPSEDDIHKIVTQCSKIAIKKLSLNDIDLSDEEFENCYEKGLQVKAKDFIQEALGNHAYKNFLDPLLRNSKPIVMEPTKIKQLGIQSKKFHHSLLKKELKKAFQKSFEFTDSDCSGSFISYGYLAVDEKRLGINSYSQKDDFEKLARRSCERIISKRSFLRKKLKTKITAEEIENEINEVIK